MLQLMGKRFFQDLIDLDPGDRWKRKLYHYIDECDAVLLFWSTFRSVYKWTEIKQVNKISLKFIYQARN